MIINTLYILFKKVNNFAATTPKLLSSVFSFIFTYSDLRESAKKISTPSSSSSIYKNQHYTPCNRFYPLSNLFSIIKIKIFLQNESLFLFCRLLISKGGFFLCHCRDAAIAAAAVSTEAIETLDSDSSWFMPKFHPHSSSSSSSTCCR